MGDFSGRAQGFRALGPRRFSIDDIDAALASCKPAIGVPSKAALDAEQRLTFESFEDFHPDRLVAALADTRRLLELERELEDPAARQSALAEIDTLAGPPRSRAGAPETVREPAAGDESDQALLGRLLGRTHSETGHGRAKRTVERLIEDALGPREPPQAPERTSLARARVAELVNERCREVMHSRAFRKLERAWRSAHWLASRLEDDEAELHLLDVSKPALAEHLATSARDLASSPLHELLRHASGEGWDLLLGDYSFGLEAEDVAALTRIGALAASARVPFVAHGELSLAGCAGDADVDSPWEWSAGDDELSELWNEFRGQPTAAWTILATPRFLLRYPYGQRNDPTETFAFEELPAEPARDRFLWANPAFACALVIARTHAGGQAGPMNAAAGEVVDLPTPIYADGTGDAVQPPLEHLLTEKAAARVAASGLAVFSGGRNTNRIAVRAVDSLAGRDARQSS